VLGRKGPVVVVVVVVQEDFTSEQEAAVALEAGVDWR
jgi:hypothetical protein